MTSLGSGGVTRADALLLPLAFAVAMLAGVERESEPPWADVLEVESSLEGRVGTGRHCDDVEADVTRSSRSRVWALFSASSQDSRSLEWSSYRRGGIASEHYCLVDGADILTVFPLNSCHVAESQLAVKPT